MKRKNKKEIRVLDVIKKFLDDNETTFFQPIIDKVTRATSPKNQAKATIRLPKHICDIDTRDIRKWEILCIAIPNEKVIKYFEDNE
ncbi:hypothetical protein LCGC14_1139980 [marine sediment metagenome]|uniref:Uncharacterized protein n=1 Tax=marine sediment metagenome TaxID=412755 RepID=A0A0F9PGQ7_9ZZZZ